MHDYIIKRKFIVGGERRVESSIPIISMDYLYLNIDDDADNNPTMVVQDHFHRGTWTFMVLRKSAYLQYGVGHIIEIIDKAGYARRVLKCDQETAITKV